MQMHISNPSAIITPASEYAQAMAVDDASRWLVISGQVGLEPDGELAGDTRAQAQRCFLNIIEVLHANGMKVENLVKITALLTSADDTPVYREVRDDMLSGHVCASTLLVISALAHPDWTIEIEAVAAA